GELRAFSVREGFPRLTAQSVPPGIIDSSYAIDEGQLVAFRLTQEELSEALWQMGGAHAGRGPPKLRSRPSRRSRRSHPGRRWRRLRGGGVHALGARQVGR